MIMDIRLLSFQLLSWDGKCWQGCYVVTRQAFCPDGTTTEWGCPFPYSECGLSGRTIEFDINVEGLKEKYDVFDSILSEIKDVIVTKQNKLQNR